MRFSGMDNQVLRPEIVVIGLVVLVGLFVLFVFLKASGKVNKYFKLFEECHIKILQWHNKIIKNLQQQYNLSSKPVEVK